MCDLCDAGGTEDALKKLQALQDKALAAYGWYVHAVGNEMHTHGIVENHSHPDLQIVGFSKVLAHGVLVSIVTQIQAGFKYEAGKEYEGIVEQGFKVRFETALDGSREVLRVIIPDAEGKTLISEISPDFQIQWTGVIQKGKKAIWLPLLSQEKAWLN